METFDVVFAAYLQDETVEVMCRIVNGDIDWDFAAVMYQGVDVLPILNFEALKTLERQFEEDAEHICKFDRL